jgi:hypothetical protein
MIAVIGLLPIPVLYTVDAGNNLFQRAAWLFWLWVLFLGSFAWLATVVPGALYFLLQGLEFGDIRRRFLDDVVKLDPSVSSVDDAEQLHTFDLQAALPVDVGARALIQILGCTLVIAAGWTIILHQVPLEFVDGTHPLFSPIADPITFGFMGGYFFALFSTLRRYFQTDLSPRAYTGILVRLVLTLLLAWVLTAVASEVTGSSSLGLVAALAFLVGIIPEAGLAVIADIVRRGLSLPGLAQGLEDAHPLTDLAGISYYDSARFSEEGIYNVENLVRANLYGLMLRTRFGTDMLVDLFDQAILYLHARGDKDYLCQLGVRTATDLAIAIEKMASAECGTSDQGKTNVNQSTDVTQRLIVVAAVIARERWMPHLMKWRFQSEHTPPDIATQPPSLASPAT